MEQKIPEECLYADSPLKRLPDFQNGNLPTLLRAKEVSKICRCSTRTIYRLSKSGELPSLNLGGTILFDLTAVLAAIANSKTSKR